MNSTVSIVLSLWVAASLLFAEERPNILFIFTDDHTSRAISAYGSKMIDTEHMDRIAKEGMMLKKCYVTNGICGPSRAVILTGKHSHQNGFVRNGNTFNGKQQTFPKLLRTHGYETAVIGKWHLKSNPTGFNYYDVLVGQGPYYNPPMKTNANGQEGEIVKHTGYTTHIITDKALTWLKEDRDQAKPFMLMYQHKAPHRNWQPGPDYLNLYDDVEMPEPETLWDDYKNRSSAPGMQKMTVAEHLTASDLKLTAPKGLTNEQRAKWDAAYDSKNEAFKKANLSGKELVKWKYQRYVKDYLRCVKAVDDDIGKVLKYLDESGLAKNTIVMYSSDQGWYLGEHGWYDKRWMYEESLVMPCLIRWPGVIQPGSESESIVSNLDFAGTFLDIAGAEVPGDMQGRSFLPILKGKTPDGWRTHFYYHYYEGLTGAHHVPRHFGVTNGTHKLINYYGIKEFEMFDLDRDPNELKSVYDNPEYAAIQKSLEVTLDGLRKQYAVPAEDPPQNTRARRKRKPKKKKSPEKKKAA